MIELIYIVVTVGVVANVWTLMTDAGELFDFVPPLLERAPDKLQKVLYQCPKCFAGQLMFWLYPLLYGFNHLDVGWQGVTFFVIPLPSMLHISLVFWAIFMSFIISILIHKIQN